MKIKNKKTGQIKNTTEMAWKKIKARTNDWQIMDGPKQPKVETEKISTVGEKPKVEDFSKKEEPKKSTGIFSKTDTDE